jgi:hypothetical protein
MISFDIYYIAIKIFFLASLVRSFVVFDPLKKHWLFIAILYTAVIAGLCWVFFSWKPGFTMAEYQRWAGITLVGSAIYFKLLEKFEEARLFFWLILLGGMALLIYW